MHIFCQSLFRSISLPCQIEDVYQKIDRKLLNPRLALSQRIKNIQTCIFLSKKFITDEKLAINLRAKLICKQTNLLHLEHCLTLKIHQAALYYFDSHVYPFSTPPLFGCGWSQIPEGMIEKIIDEINCPYARYSFYEKTSLIRLCASLRSTAFVFAHQHDFLFHPASNTFTRRYFFAQKAAHKFSNAEIGWKFFLPALSVNIISRQLSGNHFSLVKLEKISIDTWKATCINVGYGCYSTDYTGKYCYDLCFIFSSNNLVDFLATLFETNNSQAELSNKLISFQIPYSLVIFSNKKSTINKPVCSSQTWQAAICDELGQELYEKFFLNQAKKDRKAIQYLRHKIGKLSLCEADANRFQLSEFLTQSKTIHEELYNRIIHLMAGPQIESLAKRILCPA